MDGMRVGSLLADVAMEYRLRSYKVHLASTHTLIHPDSDARPLEDEEIVLDRDTDELEDPRIGKTFSCRYPQFCLIVQHKNIPMI